MLDENGNEVPDINQQPESGGDKKDNRFKDLADKVKSTAEERDAANTKLAQAEKDANFYKGFSTTASKYQGAADFQDKIKEKVDAGYDLEDATISVLAKEGKYTPQAPQVQRESPTGGSATTQLKDVGDKTINEMTHAEKREALIQLENESGGVSNMLRRKGL